MIIPVAKFSIAADFLQIFKHKNQQILTCFIFRQGKQQRKNFILLIKNPLNRSEAA